MTKDKWDDEKVERSGLAEQLTQMHFTHLKELSRMGERVIAQGEDGVLLCLYSMRRPMLSGDLVEHMGLTTGRVANILKRLEQKGLILRTQDDEDRRKAHVSLTERGEALAQQKYADILQAYRQLLAHLGEHDSKDLIRILSRCMGFYREIF